MVLPLEPRRGSGPRLAHRHRPINPPVEHGVRGDGLPAYVSNGFLGLRVRENPLRAGMCMVAGFSGDHPERRVEAAATAPYPLAGDLAVGDVWMSDQPEAVELTSQAYDFATAELTSRIAFTAGAARVTAEIVTFCSRDHPSLACQQVVVRAEGACELAWRARIDPAAARGSVLERRLDTPGEAKPVADGAMLWTSLGGLARCGVALWSEGPSSAERSRTRWNEDGALETTYRLRLRAGQRVVFRQMASLVPSVMHAEPDAQAVRLLAQALETGFDEVRSRNRACWARLWRGRIRIVGADARWQALADAAFFYLNTSIHPASPASTSIFGLATWTDYHYYFGHVMWDIDAFAAPPATLFQPLAARALLDFRSRHLQAARDNAKLQGLPGLRFPWEAAPSTGQEATPGPASGAAREDHVSLHVAEAFALFAEATGDHRFLREQAWPVVSGVADWIVGRVTPRPDGRCEWLQLGGPAERVAAVDNDALTNLLGARVLRRAASMADALGQPADPRWMQVSRGLAPPLRADGAIADHDGHRFDEEQGAAPSALMALFPYWIDLDPAVARRTLEAYVGRWADFVGAPMLCAFYPTWAAWLGDRALSARLLEEGYGAYIHGRFAQTLEYRLDKTIGGVAAGPFFANIGGFLMTLVLGLPRLRPSAGPPQDWPQGEVVLPSGWRAIECDQLWIQGRPARLSARHGSASAELVWADAADR